MNSLTVKAGVASWGWWLATRAVDKTVVRLEVNLGSNVSLSSRSGADVILSPDGTRLVFVSTGRLFTRRLDQLTAIELANTEGAIAPFFSPDGKSIGFFSDSRLKRISLEGGAAITVCAAQDSAKGGSWGDDDFIIASLHRSGPLWRVPASGGKPEQITEIDQERGERAHRWPQVLPGAGQCYSQAIRPD